MQNIIISVKSVLKIIDEIIYILIALGLLNPVCILHIQPCQFRLATFQVLSSHVASGYHTGQHSSRVCAWSQLDWIRKTVTALGRGDQIASISAPSYLASSTEGAFYQPQVNECRVDAKTTGSADKVSTPLPVTLSKLFNLSASCSYLEDGNYKSCSLQGLVRIK